jgi:glycosyltransferase involved in cell wall biosynthesis
MRRFWLGRLFLLIPFYLSSLFQLFKIRSKLIVVTFHSLNVLPLVLLIKFFFNVKCIYAPHELEGEKAFNSSFVRKVRRFVESKLIEFCDSIIAVNQEIANWYDREYRLSHSTHYIYNFPTVGDSNSLTYELENLRDTLHLQSQILLVTHGILEKGRGLEKLLEAMRLLESSKYHLIVIGEGGLLNMLKRSAPFNVSFYPFVEQHNLVNVISQADIGLVLIEDSAGLSYAFSSPNKLFESLRSGLFVVGSNLVEFRKFLANDRYSMLLPEITESSIVDCIIAASEIVKSPDYERTPRLEYDWKWEAERLSKIYLEILG